MAEAPAFSVILPVYNRTATLDRALASVAAQRYAPLDIIAVDDGSSDDSLAKLQSWQARLPNLVVVAQANAGVAAARNNAVRRARGDWLAFIDSDDAWRGELLAKYRAAIAGNPDIDLLHSDRVAPDGTSRKDHFPDRAHGFYESPAALFTHWCIKTSSVALRASLYHQVGGFIENLYSCSDYEFFWRAAFASRQIGYVDEPLVDIHHGALGMARKLPTHARLRDNLRAMASAIDWMRARQGQGGEAQRLLAAWRSREFRALIRESIKRGALPDLMQDIAAFSLEAISGRYHYAPHGRAPAPGR